MRIIDSAIALNLPLQINTTVSRITLPHLHAMARRMEELPIALWAVFFLVQTGRGASLDQVSDAECEEVLGFLYDLSLTSRFGIKTTEAPHYQRVVQQRERAREAAGLPTLAVERRRQLRATRSVGDGNGFVFVDHVGNICPSGFLPLTRGNVRADSLAAVYRDDEVFRGLRDADALEGKCGACEFRATCGGSRSRAFAATGSAMASDPLCAYVPAAYAGSGLETPRRAAAEGPRTIALHPVPVSVR